MLLRMTEKLMNVGDEDKVSVRNLNQKNSSKKAIPPLASSVFLRSAQYRRLLYGGNPAKDDERFDLFFFYSCFYFISILLFNALGFVAFYV